DPHRVVTVGGREKPQYRIRPEASLRIVVVLVIEPMNRQAVVHWFGSRRQRPDDITRLAQRMRHRRGLEPGATVPEARIDLETRVRSARIEVQLHDLAVDKKQLVQLHLLPVVYAEIVRSVRVLATKRE